MATFHITAGVTISVTATVEAETEEEARELAEGLMLPTLCHMCQRDRGEDVDVDEGEAVSEWTVDELDGEPEITAVRSA